MIHYNLICHQGHEFDGWFADSAAFDKQTKRGLLACPACSSTKVDRAIMAPRVISSKRRRLVDAEASAVPSKEATEAAQSTEANRAQARSEVQASAPVAMMSPAEAEIRAKLKELRNHIVKNADNVGAKFPEEARKMHYGEIEHRSIYGIASPEEAKELANEGVPFQPLPVLPEDRN